MNLKIWIVAVAVALFSGGEVRAQTDTKTVRAEDLIRNPQRYWAQSFVFADVLRTHPARVMLKLDRRRYMAFGTEAAGRCYVAEELAPIIQDLPLERRYQFLSTVLQQGRHFFIIVRGVSAAVEQGDLKFDWPAISESPEEFMKAQALRPVLDILTTAEGAHVAYAKERGVSVEKLYDPRSEHFGLAMNEVRAAIARYEQQARMPASEILTGYLFQILAARHLALEKKAAPMKPKVAEPPRAPKASQPKASSAPKAPTVEPSPAARREARSPGEGAAKAPDPRGAPRTKATEKNRGQTGKESQVRKDEIPAP